MEDSLWDDSLEWVWGWVVGWLGTTSLGLWQESSFLLQTGLTEIRAVLEVFGFWLLEDDMFGCDGINGGRRVFIVYEKCGLGRKIWGIVWDKICLWILGSIGWNGSKSDKENSIPDHQMAGPLKWRPVPLNLRGLPLWFKGAAHLVIPRMPEMGFWQKIFKKVVFLDLDSSKFNSWGNIEHTIHECREYHRNNRSEQ